MNEDTGADPWVTYSRITLIFTGVVYVGLGLGMSVFLGPMMELDRRPDDPPMPDAFLTIMSVIMFAMCAGFGAVNFLAAWGLGKRARWSWYATVVLGGIYAPSACLPFGVLLLYGMLNERTRRSFLG